MRQTRLRRPRACLIYIYIYIYIYIHTYIYIYAYIYIYILYVCIYIYREREIERYSYMYISMHICLGACPAAGGGGPGLLDRTGSPLCPGGRPPRCFSLFCIMRCYVHYLLVCVYFVCDSLLFLWFLMLIASFFVIVFLVAASASGALRDRKFSGGKQTASPQAVTISTPDLRRPRERQGVIGQGLSGGTG